MKIQREQRDVIEAEGFTDVRFVPGGKHWTGTAYYKGTKCDFRLPCTPGSYRWKEHLRNDCRRHKRAVDAMQGNKPQCQKSTPVPQRTKSPWEAPVPNYHSNGFAKADDVLTNIDIEIAEAEKAPAKTSEQQHPAAKEATMATPGKGKAKPIDERTKVRLGIWMNTQYEIVTKDDDGAPITCRPKDGQNEKAVFEKAQADGFVPEGYAYHTYQIYRTKLFGRLHSDSVDHAGKGHGKKNGASNADVEVVLGICTELEVRIGKIEASVARIEQAIHPIIGAP